MYWARILFLFLSQVVCIPEFQNVRVNTMSLNYTPPDVLVHPSSIRGAFPLRPPPTTPPPRDPPSNPTLNPVLLIFLRRKSNFLHTDATQFKPYFGRQFLSVIFFKILLGFHNLWQFIFSQNLLSQEKILGYGYVFLFPSLLFWSFTGHMVITALPKGHPPAK